MFSKLDYDKISQRDVREAGEAVKKIRESLGLTHEQLGGEKNGIFLRSSSIRNLEDGKQIGYYELKELLDRLNCANLAELTQKADALADMVADLGFASRTGQSPRTRLFSSPEQAEWEALTTERRQEIGQAARKLRLNDNSSQNAIGRRIGKGDKQAIISCFERGSRLGFKTAQEVMNAWGCDNHQQLLAKAARLPDPEPLPYRYRVREESQDKPPQPEPAMQGILAGLTSDQLGKIGDAAFIIREDVAKSRRQLAQQAGVMKVEISRLERGVRLPPDTAERILSALGYATPQALLDNAAEITAREAGIAQQRQEQKQCFIEQRVALGKAGKKVRSSQELTQSDLAKAAGVTSSQVFTFEKGRLADEKITQKIIKSLGCDDAEALWQKAASLTVIEAQRQPLAQRVALGEAGKKVRISQKLTKSALAEAAGVTPSQIDSFENGKLVNEQIKQKIIKSLACDDAEALLQKAAAPAVIEALSQPGPAQEAYYNDGLHGAGGAIHRIFQQVREQSRGGIKSIPQEQIERVVTPALNEHKQKQVDLTNPGTQQKIVQKILKAGKKDSMAELLRTSRHAMDKPVHKARHESEKDSHFRTLLAQQQHDEDTQPERS